MHLADSVARPSCHRCGRDGGVLGQLRTNLTVPTGLFGMGAPLCTLTPPPSLSTPPRQYPLGGVAPGNHAFRASWPPDAAPGTASLRLISPFSSSSEGFTTHMCFFLVCEQTPNALQMGHIPRIQELPVAPTEEKEPSPGSG